jgi:hypothetical protein
VAAPGALLMSASPDRPAQPVSGVSEGDGDQGGEQVLDLVAGQPDQPGRWWVASVFGHGRHYQEGVGEYRQGDPAVPGAPAADLVLVQADQALAGLEALLDGPAAPGDPDQGGQKDGAGCPAAVEGQLAGSLVAADQQPVLGSLIAILATVEADERPVVIAVALGASAGRDALPGPRWDAPEQGVGTLGAPPARTGWSQATAST